MFVRLVKSIQSEWGDSAPQPHLSWVQQPLSPGANLEVTAEKNTHPLLIFHEGPFWESLREVMACCTGRETEL